MDSNILVVFPWVSFGTFVGLITTAGLSIYMAVKVNKVAEKVEVVHVNTNSINAKMAVLERAAGVTEGIAQERERMAAEAALKALGAKEAQERSTATGPIVATGGATPVVIEQPPDKEVPVKIGAKNAS